MFKRLGCADVIITIFTGAVAPTTTGGVVGKGSTTLVSGTKTGICAFIFVSTRCTVGLRVTTFTSGTNTCVLTIIVS